MSRDKPIEYLTDWERWLVEKLGFRLVHDGQNNPGQFTLPPAEVKFFTRRYQWYLTGDKAFVNTFIVFKCDRRSGEEKITWYLDDKDFDTKIKKEEMSLIIKEKDEPGEKASVKVS